MDSARCVLVCVLGRPAFGFQSKPRGNFLGFLVGTDVKTQPRLSEAAKRWAAALKQPLEAGGCDPRLVLWMPAGEWPLRAKQERPFPLCHAPKTERKIGRCELVCVFVAWFGLVWFRCPALGVRLYLESSCWEFPARGCQQFSAGPAARQKVAPEESGIGLSRSFGLWYPQNPMQFRANCSAPC